MKKNLFIIFAVFAALSLTACNNLEDENVLAYDGETLVSDVVPTAQCTNLIIANAAGGNGSVTYTANAPLSASSASPFVSITNGNGNFAYSLSAIKPVERELDGVKTKVTLTRDIAMYLNPEARTKYRNYGYYTYPIVIRQYGEVTQYLHVANIPNFVDNKDFSDQYYLLGTVKGVSSIETDTYPISKYPVNPQYFYDRGAMPALSDEQCPTNLSEKFMTVTLDIDGTTVKVLVNDLARDTYIDNLAATLKTGDTVEIALMHAKYDANYNGIIDVNPFAFVIK